MNSDILVPLARKVIQAVRCGRIESPHPWSMVDRIGSKWLSAWSLYPLNAMLVAVNCIQGALAINALCIRANQPPNPNPL